MFAFCFFNVLHAVDVMTVLFVKCPVDCISVMSHFLLVICPKRQAT